MNTTTPDMTTTPPFLICENSNGLLNWTGDERPCLASAISAAKALNEWLAPLGRGGSAVVLHPNGSVASASSEWAPRHP